ncbi:hypothetical protein ACFP81_12365 [Deinococcus lacus]|uniref:DUF11 domain-containing protein n=1 Tax=Deinococcus lacus TaxID=392561 RepID=A0ABW1YEL0_9DEIO
MLAAWAQAPASAQAPVAGTAITNQAQASVVLQTGQVARSLSNVVSTRVTPVCGVSVTPNGTLRAPGQVVTLLPSESGYLTYRVQNTGNQAQTFPLTLEASGVPVSASVRLDEGNGAWDGTEPVVSSLTLDAGQSRLVFVAVSAGAAVGEADFNLVTSCSGGQPDADNLARVLVGPAPDFSLTKAFGAEVLRPGDATDVTLTLRNQGAGASRNLTLTDLLSDQVAAGLRFVAGSARTTAGTLEYSADGVTWQAAEPAQVRGVRLRADSLAAGTQATVTFRVQASADMAPAELRNVATLVTSVGGDLQASDTLAVRFSPAVAIGPVGSALAQGEADRQTQPLGLASGETCFTHTLRNTGDVADNYRITVSYQGGAATATVRDAAGTPVTGAVTLLPGAETDVQVCYSALSGERLEVLVTAQGERGPLDTTVDQIGRIETRLPQLLKSVRNDSDTGWTERAAVESGDLLTYTLRVTNPYEEALSGVRVSDQLPQGVEFVSAASNPVVTGTAPQRLEWDLGTLAPGEVRDLPFQVRVTATADDQSIVNTFSVVSRLFPGA